MSAVMADTRQVRVDAAARNRFRSGRVAMAGVFLVAVSAACSTPCVAIGACGIKEERINTIRLIPSRLRLA